MANRTFSFSSTPATYRLFSIVCILSSASKGSSDLVNIGGLVFWKFFEFVSMVLLISRTMVVIVGHLSYLLKSGEVGLAFSSFNFTVIN